MFLVETRSHFRIITCTCFSRNLLSLAGRPSGPRHSPTSPCDFCPVVSSGFSSVWPFLSVFRGLSMLLGG